MASYERSIPQAFSLLADLEAILYSVPDFIEVRRLARLMGVAESTVEGLLEELSAKQAGGGVLVQRQGNGVRLVTSAETFEILQKLESSDRIRLSRVSLDVLSIIAYEQPSTRAEIDEIRGVVSDSPLKTLLAAGLIEPVGRLESAGRPIQYGTTAEFLSAFGLRSLADLPPLEDEEE